MSRINLLDYHFIPHIIRHHARSLLTLPGAYGFHNTFDNIKELVIELSSIVLRENTEVQAQHIDCGLDERARVIVPSREMIFQ